jgi:hypothetical protein
MRAGIAALVLAALLVPTAAPAKDATPSQIIKRFNKERKANGFPKVKLNKTWSKRCKKHNAWMKRNKVLQHDEIPGTPGYSKDGAWAGMNSVLSQDTTWLRGQPWLNAPIHLNQMLSPMLKRAGAHESKDRNCFTTFVGYNYSGPRPRTQRVYRYPKVAPYAQSAYEFPHSPQHWIGIKDERKTGPYIYVFWDGPAPELGILKSARMTGPNGGKVKVKVLNARTHSGDGYFLAPNSGFVLPPRPLQKNADYSVSVTFTTDRGVTPKRSFKASFTFRTNSTHLTKLGPAFTGHFTG